MNKNSNTYTIVYIAVMVVLVSALLSFAAISLKDAQDKNKEIEKKMNILSAVKKAQDLDNAADKNSYVEAEFKKYIVEMFLVDAKGNKASGDAFNANLKASLKLKDDERKLPIFVYKEGVVTKYIFPIYGAGLWGPIWGYIALDDDFKTVFGATFDHKGETPGLGAEIATPDFQKQFERKEIFSNGQFSSIQIIKPGSVPLNDHSVDGISGGTITSKALEETIDVCLSNYKSFFEKNKKVAQPVETTIAADSISHAPEVQIQ